MIQILFDRGSLCVMPYGKLPVTAVGSVLIHSSFRPLGETFITVYYVKSIRTTKSGKDEKSGVEGN